MMNPKFHPKGFLFLIVAVVFGIMVFQNNACGQQITAVNSQEFFDNYLHLLEDGNALIIDGRTQRMFSGGHLKNAINIDADDPDLLTLLQQHLNEPQIVVYCTTVRRTIKIVSTLIDIYDGNIIFISDGIRGWLQNGYPHIVFTIDDKNSLRKNTFDTVKQNIQPEEL